MSTLRQPTMNWQPFLLAPAVESVYSVPLAVWLVRKTVTTTLTNFIVNKIA